MTRKDFFKKLGIGSIIALATPEILAEIPKEPITPPKDEEYCLKWVKVCYQQWNDINKWKQTGQLIYRYPPYSDWDDLVKQYGVKSVKTKIEYKKMLLSL